MKKNISILVTAMILSLVFSNKASSQSISDIKDALGKSAETYKTDKAAAVKQLEEVISLCDKVGDSAAMATKAKYLGFLAKWQNNNTIDLLSAKKYTEALNSSEKAISLCTTYKDNEGLASANALLAKTYYAQGIDQYTSKNYDGALASFAKAAETAKANNLNEIADKANSLTSKVYMIKGSELYSAKKFDDAIAAFEQATKVDPKNVKAFYYKGLAFKGKNDLDNMLTSMDKAIELGSTLDTAVATSAKRNIANTFLVKASDAYSTKQYAEAITAAKTATKYDGKNSKTFLILAVSNNALGQSDEAIEAAKSGIAIESKSEALSDLYFQIGKAYEKKKDNASACANYKKVVAGANAATAKSIMSTVLKCK
jgi:tetratricopeptide (TPR) repeat protein